MTDIKRIKTGQRMSQAVIHNDIVYLAGQVGEAGASAADQTRQILTKIESLLAEAGSSTEKMLRAEIWLSDMAYFAEMNDVWDNWVPEGCAPARACGESKLASPDLYVEIIITAAI